MRDLLALSVILGVGAFAWSACGGHPGGTVGDPCSDIGSSSECFDDEICDDTYAGPYCLRECSDHGDCDPDERCNGTSGQSQKTCHPQDPDDDFDDCDPDFDPGCDDDGKGKGK